MNTLKILSIVCSILLLTISCSKSDEDAIVGTWTAVNSKTLCSINIDAVAEYPSIYGSGFADCISITFYSDGVFKETPDEYLLKQWAYPSKYEDIRERCLQLYNGTYSLDGNKLTITDKFRTLTYTVKISGKKLTISNGNMERNYTR